MLLKEARTGFDSPCLEAPLPSARTVHVGGTGATEA